MGVVQSFFKGFNEGGSPPDVVVPDMDGGVGTEDDFIDYASLDQIQASRQETQSDGDREAEPVRTINNALDFLGHVSEEVSEWVERETGDGHQVIPQPDSRLVLGTGEIGADSWKGTRYAVDKELQIVRRNKDRRSVRFVNLGPDPVFISQNTRAGVGIQTNTFTLPVSKVDGTGPYTPVEIETQDEVWATPTTAGTACTVEVLDVFGVPDAD